MGSLYILTAVELPIVGIDSEGRSGEHHDLTMYEDTLYIASIVLL
jgi:hypothetical protein